MEYIQDRQLSLLGNLRVMSVNVACEVRVKCKRGLKRYDSTKLIMRKREQIKIICMESHYVEVKLLYDGYEVRLVKIINNRN